MARSGASLGDTQDIRSILQRVARDESPLLLRSGSRQAQGWLQQEGPEQLVWVGELRDLEALGLGAGEPVQLEFTDRGRVYQAVAAVQRIQLLDPIGVMLVPPRALTCLNPDAFLDLVLDRPPRATYVTVGHDLRDGRAVGLAEQGLELAWGQGKREDFRIGAPTQVSVELAKGTVPVLDTTPLYFTDDTVGLKITGAKDPEHLERFQTWVRDRLHETKERERLDFSREGFSVSRDTLAARRSTAHELRMLSDRSPHVLVVGEDSDLAARLAQVLGRKFGVGFLDWIMGPLETQVTRTSVEAPWGGFRLILVQQRLKLTSGYELIRQLVQQEQCPLPVLMVGTEEDVALKRNRAIAAGAVDYLPTEPFHVLSVMRAIEETLKAFG